MRVALLFCLPALITGSKVNNIIPIGIGKEVIKTNIFPIDVVYTWVSQPSKTEYQQILKDCGGKLDGGMQRLRNMGTFRTSLRMLEQNMPWVRKVFVVTPNGDAPTWLNRQNPSIKVVDQNDLFPQKSDLPVHNSQQVEVHLHRIHGLAEHFIYFNDDMFAGKPLQRNFFFSSDGKPIFRTKGNPPKEKSWRSRSEPGNLMGEHMPYPLTISMVSEMQQIWPRTFARISSAHCRGDLPVHLGPGWLYQWFGVQSASTEVSRTGQFSWLRDTNVHMASAWYKQQLHNRPDLVCINDNFERRDMRIFKHQMTELRAFMNKFSAGKASRFERGTNENDFSVMLVACADDGCLPQLSAEST